MSGDSNSLQGQINEFMIGYNGWVAMTIPNKRPYANYEEKKSYDEIKLRGQENNNNNNIIFLQVNSASVTRSLNVPTSNSYYLPFIQDKQDKIFPVRSPIRNGYGTVTFTGNLDFQLNLSSLKLLTENDVTNDDTNDIFLKSYYGDFFRRDSSFDVQFFDGENTCTLLNCVWDSFSINCQPNSLVTASLSFQSNNAYHDSLFVIHDDLRPSYVFDTQDLLIPYWQTGRQDMISFNVSFQRNVSPVFLNNAWVTPSYFRPGLINMSLNATYIEYSTGQYQSSSSSKENLTEKEWSKYDGVADNDSDVFVVNIGSLPKGNSKFDCGKKIIFNRPVLNSLSYSMSNMNDTGEKTLQWSSIPLDNRQCIFIIKNI